VLFVSQKNMELGAKDGQMSGASTLMEKTKKYILTEEKKKMIIDFLRNRFYSKAIIVLNNLEELKEDELLNDLKTIVRNSGRSNMISISELQNLVEDFENAKPDKN
jgi:Uri superfamily endonuclease